MAIFCVYSFPTSNLFQKGTCKDNYPFLSIVVTQSVAYSYKRATTPSV